jgi:hypothetical protein
MAPVEAHHEIRSFAPKETTCHLRANEHVPIKPGTVFKVKCLFAIEAIAAVYRGAGKRL